MANQNVKFSAQANIVAGNCGMEQVLKLARFHKGESCWTLKGEKYGANERSVWGMFTKKQWLALYRAAKKAGAKLAYSAVQSEKEWRRSCYELACSYAGMSYAPGVGYYEE